MKYHLKKTFALCKKKAKSFVKLRRKKGVSEAQEYHKLVEINAGRSDWPIRPTQ
jgi:hypothetical protein